MCWRHLPVSNVHGNILKYKTACQVRVDRHLWKRGRIISQHFVLMQHGSFSKVKQSSITLPLPSDFCYWVEVWVSYMGNQILPVLLIWIICTVNRLCTLRSYWCAFCAVGDGETRSLSDLMPPEVLGWGYCPSCRWTSGEKNAERLINLGRTWGKRVTVSMRKRGCWGP